VSRNVTVTLTARQAEALWFAAMYLTEIVPDADGMNGRDLRVTENAKAKLRAAIDGPAETKEN
jgi:hypothetical protein